MAAILRLKDPSCEAISSSSWVSVSLVATLGDQHAAAHAAARETRETRDARDARMTLAVEVAPRRRQRLSRVCVSDE